MAIYDKPVRLLMRDMVQALNIMPGEVIDREQVVEWFAKHYPLIRSGTVSAHLVLLSTNDRGRLHHKPKPTGEDDLFYRTGTGQYRLFNKASDPKPIMHESQALPDAAAQETPFEAMNKEADSEFAYEHDLQDYLARNLHLIEPGLELYRDEAINGIEFPVGGRFIDILAVDENGGYVVIELKVSKGYDRVVGQLLRYIGSIKTNHAEPGQRVRGIIVAKTISEDILLACSELPHVKLFEYSLAVSLRSISSATDPKA